MTKFRTSILIVLGSLVTACSAPDTATRSVAFPSGEVGSFDANVESAYDLRNVTLATAGELSVSESNSFYPTADIVWRGDPYGDRAAQVLSMFDTALARNDPKMTGDIPIDVKIDLVRFHGVTERTRYSVGGVYNIIFDMTVLNAETGEVIEPTRRVEGNLPSGGGAAALLADQRGETEKVQVTDFLTVLLGHELKGQTTL